MRRLFFGAITLPFLAAALFVGGIAAQDDVTFDRGERRHKESVKSDEPRFNSILAGIVVNNSGDATDVAPGNGICETAAGNGICTLRAAVAEANALPGDDTITFEPTIINISIDGQIAITSNLNIIGNGPGVITISNVAPLSTTSRIFNVTNFVVNLSGMTLSGGNITGNGGAINNTGTLTLANMAVNDNRASATGGGIRSTNTLQIYNSVINGNASTASTSGGISFAGSNLLISNTALSNNTSFGNGGGINISATVSANISNSTINGNVAGASSGGLFLNRGTITNTTISGNTANGALATDGGGGIRIQAGANSVAILSSTITNNTAPNSSSGARSGIWHETGTLTLTNSIVAGNVAQDIQRDGTGVITSGGFNLIGENTSVTTEFPAGSPSGTDYVGTDKAPINASLGTLANNGGLTLTHALLTGSIAIDKGSAQGLTGDQRGYIRTVDLPGTPNSPTGDGTDIGAYETESSPNTAGFSVSGRVTNSSGIGVAHQQVIFTDHFGNPKFAFTSSFGYYRIENMTAGMTYVGNVPSKRYQFSPRVVAGLYNDITGVNFMAEP